MSNKERYRILCETDNSIPLFLQAWWMDAVCGDNWDVFIYCPKNEIIGTLVYHFKTKFSIKAIIQPQLTQHNGIWINYTPNLSSSKKLNLEHEVITNLIEQLEQSNIDYYDQNFHWKFTNWLPYYWKGYKQTTRYTYQIKDISNPDSFFEKFSHGKKNQIKKSEKELQVKFNLECDTFYSEHKKNLIYFNQKILYSYETFQSIYKSATERNQGFIVSASDNKGNIHASLFVIWDSCSAYNLISSINPLFRSSGASTLVVWEAIKFLSSKTQTFDFEGSMNKNIEKSFREFGTEQVAYMRILKSKSLFINIIQTMKKKKEYRQNH